MGKDILPVIDTEILQQKANEYAMKGAEEALKEFYSGYNSPYRKAIEENLKNKGVDTSFDLPDIVAVINDRLTQEIDLIANTALSKSFIPLVKRFLTREDEDVKFSKILKEFIEVSDFDINEIDIDDYTTEKELSSTESFFHYKISNGKIGYNLHFYKNNDKTTIIYLPRRLNENGKYYGSYESKEVMKISLDGGATLEVPFTKGILEDSFVSFIGRLVLGNTNIIFDVNDFYEDLFPKDECHCN